MRLSGMLDRLTSSSCKKKSHTCIYLLGWGKDKSKNSRSTKAWKIPCELDIVNDAIRPLVLNFRSYRLVIKRVGRQTFSFLSIILIQVFPCSHASQGLPVWVLVVLSGAFANTACCGIRGGKFSWRFLLSFSIRGSEPNPKCVVHSANHSAEGPDFLQASLFPLGVPESDKSALLSHQGTKSDSSPQGLPGELPHRNCGRPVPSEEDAKMGWKGFIGENASVRGNRKSEKARRVIRFKSDSLVKDGRRVRAVGWKCPRLLCGIRKVWKGHQRAFKTILVVKWVSTFSPRKKLASVFLSCSVIGWKQLYEVWSHISLDGVFKALKIGPLVSYTSYSSNYHARQQNTLVKRGALDPYYCVNFNLSSATYYLRDVWHVIYFHYASILSSVKWGQ